MKSEHGVAKIFAKARNQGLLKRIAGPVWREFIDRGIVHEPEIWAEAHKSPEMAEK